MSEPRTHTVGDGQDDPAAARDGLRGTITAVDQWADPVACEVAADLLARVQAVEEERDALRERVQGLEQDVLDARVAAANDLLAAREAWATLRDAAREVLDADAARRDVESGPVGPDPAGHSTDVMRAHERRARAFAALRRLLSGGAS